MNEERAISQISHIGKVTGETLLKAFWLMIEKSGEYINAKKSNKIYTGETEWNKLLATSDQKDIKTFLSSEINLSQLKKELEKYQIPFSFYEKTNNEVALCFDVKNEALIGNAFEKIVKDITTNTKEINQRLLKTPKNMNLNEKIKYYKQKNKNNLNIKSKKTLKLSEMKGRSR